MEASHSPRSTARMLMLWSAAFCLLTLIAGVGASFAGGAERKALPSVIATLGSSPPLLATLAIYLTVYLGLHLLAAMVWSRAWAPVGARLAARADQRKLALLSFLPLFPLLLLVNARLYPGSSFAPAFSPDTAIAAGWLSWILAAYVAAVLVAHAWLRIPRSRIAGVTAAGAAGLLIAWWSIDAGPVPAGAAGRERPDVILIGVDGLRPDHVDPLLTPALHDLVSGGVRIDDAWTPLARTFPAWVSVLTGRYPSSHGAYFNLVPRDRVDDSGSLAHRLGGLGYERVYAIDETRFSNMDRTFGFDHRVGPPIGGFDFMMSVIGDLPLMNLVAGMRAGRYLFPFAHGNRALAATYRPEIFDDALERAIHDLDQGRPMFLLAHFELPHWPFTWADAGSFEFTAPPHLSESSPSMYQRTLARADMQVASLLSVLESAGRLENAVLVVLSDHGQAFHAFEPAWQPASGEGVRLQPYPTHGTHVMSAAQNRVLLAFRGYGPAGSRLVPAHVRGATVSLADVRPTLDEWLGIPAPGHVAVDGESLWPLLTGAPARADRAVPLETGFSPLGVTTGSPDVAELVVETAHYYDVGGDGRLSLRTDLLDGLIARKQRAVVMGEWILAAMPDHRYLILGNFDALIYTGLRADGETPGAAPLPRLLATMCAHYQGGAGILADECPH